MSELSNNIDIEAAPDEVWSVLIDLDRLGEWVNEHRGFSGGAPSELREGVSYKRTLAAAGQEVDVEWTVVEMRESSLLAFSGAGPAGSTASLRYELADAGDGATRVGYETSFDMPGGAVGKAIGSAVEPDESDAQATLERLKRVVESG